MEIEKLKTIVLTLLAGKREGDYWDFKERVHTNKADLLHDILCMANNLANHDAYIIFGVEDRTFDVKGIESDPNRRDQKYYVTFLKDKKFAGGIRPETKLLTIQVESKELDVLIIRNSIYTPYHVLESFKDQGREVKANSIYTRIGDTNTDINKTADIVHVEALWAKRLKINDKFPTLKICLVDAEDNRKDLKFTYISPTGLLNENLKPLEETDLVKGVTLEEMQIYNEGLPKQEEINEYNNRIVLYENAQKNCYELKIVLTNEGKAKANSIHVILDFPSEILVYNEYDIKNIEEPKKPKIPKNPNRKALYKATQSRFDYLFENPVAVYTGYESLRPPITLLTNGGHSDYYIDPNHSELHLRIDDLLHTMQYKSDEFNIIITQSGNFVINYRVMCEEFEEPVNGQFEVNVE